MGIELTAKQAEAINGVEIVQRCKALEYDNRPWTADVMAILAGAVFSKLDNSDYSLYLES